MGWLSPGTRTLFAEGTQLPASTLETVRNTPGVDWAAPAWGQFAILDLHDRRAAVVLVVNKWDLVPKDTWTAQTFEEKLRHDLGFLKHAPLIFVSALTGQRVSKLFALIDQVAEAHARRIPTGRLNQFLREAVAAMSPHAAEGKTPKLYFMTQVGVRPPTFVIKANTDRGLHFSYLRYLENRLRTQFGFLGTPIRLSVQKKQRGEDGPSEKAPVRRILDVGEGLRPGRRRLGAGGGRRRSRA